MTVIVDVYFFIIEKISSVIIRIIAIINNTLRVESCLSEIILQIENIGLYSKNEIEKVFLR